MDNNPRPTGAYTKPPNMRKAMGLMRALPLGAGVAAAASLVWLLAPGFRARQAPAPEPSPVPASAEPAVVPAAAQNAPIAAPPVAAVARPEAAAVHAEAPPAQARAAEGVRRIILPRPAWADVKTNQAWVWPRHLSIRNDEGTIDRRLVGWFPNNPAAKRMLYSLTVDRVETRLYEDQIAAFEAQTAADIEARRLEEEEARKAEELAKEQAAAEARQREATAAHDREEAAGLKAAQQTAELTARFIAARAAQAPAAAAAPAKAGPAKRRPTAIRGAPAAGAVPAVLTQGPTYAPGVAAVPARAAVPEHLFNFKDSAEYAAWLKEIRRIEIEALKDGKGAVAARDVTSPGGLRMAELTYADGRKETVPYDPLVFDLKGTGIKTSTKKVLFDLYAYGKSDKTQWMNDLEEGTGILVFDANGSGTSGKNGSEVFGDRTDLTGVGQPTGFDNGFVALNALVLKAVDAGVLRKDVLDQGILDAPALASLEKAYGLKMKTGGFNSKAVSLSAAGVKAIALSLQPTQRAQDFDGQSNDLVVQPGAVFLRTDGTTGTYMNIWLGAKLGNLGLTSVNHLNPR